MSVTNHSGDFLRGHVLLLKEMKDLKKKKETLCWLTIRWDLISSLSRERFWIRKQFVCLLCPLISLKIPQHLGRKISDKTCFWQTMRSRWLIGANQLWVCTQNQFAVLINQVWVCTQNQFAIMIILPSVLSGLAVVKETGLRLPSHCRCVSVNTLLLIKPAHLHTKRMLAYEIFICCALSTLQ